jgi:sporulation protein YlmC with PRC-barrel domain
MRVYVLFALLACGLFLIGAGPAPVDQGANTNRGGVTVEANRGGVNVEVQGKHMMQGDQIIRAKDVSGLSVRNADNESLGKIEDLALDLHSGTIRYAVLSFGGVLGMGDKYFAIPWQKLSFVTKGQTGAGTVKESYCILDIPKDTLKNAPGFNKDQWPSFADTNFLQSIDQYYGGSREAGRERIPQR